MIKPTHYQQWFYSLNDRNCNAKYPLNLKGLHSGEHLIIILNITGGIIQDMVNPLSGWWNEAKSWVNSCMSWWASAVLFSGTWFHWILFQVKISWMVEADKEFSSWILHYHLQKEWQIMYRVFFFRLLKKLPNGHRNYVAKKGSVNAISCLIFGSPC